MHSHRSNIAAANSVSRRDFLSQAGGGAGVLGLAALLADEAQASGSAKQTIPSPHFQPRAKRVLWLFMHGGPSAMDLLDPKPELMRLSGKPLPDSLADVMTRRNVVKNPLLGPIRPFRKHGESGLELSDFLPHTAQHADKLCVLRSCHGDSVNHPQSVYQMNTGSILIGRPSVGSWVAYGLGSENRDMPAFVVLPDPSGGIKGGPPAWGAGYLPALYQGTTIRPGQTPILHVSRPSDVSAEQQRRTLDLINSLNRRHAEARDYNDELLARIESYELAFRMQSSAPELVEFTQETADTQKLYGIGEKDTDEFGTRCLLARRMLERGVRFVQVYSGDTNGWDAHSNIAKNHDEYCRRTDKPIAGLLTDLEQRGLLEDTLVIWGGEFGRMPMSEQGTGRDHNPWGYSVWFAGAHVRGGMAYGATDEVGLRAVEKPVHVHDLHATILHLLGLDHEHLTYYHNGRDERLTNVAGKVVTDILA